MKANKNTLVRYPLRSRPTVEDAPESDLSELGSLTSSNSPQEDSEHVEHPGGAPLAPPEYTPRQERESAQPSEEIPTRREGESLTDIPRIDLAKGVPNTSSTDTVLNSEQLEAVKLANRGMTDEQRRAFERPQVKVTKPSQPAVQQNSGEGTSKNKGKGIDPKNWGQMELSGEEYDPEVQEQILKACNDNIRENVDQPDEEGDAELPNSEVANATKEIQDKEPSRDDLKERIRQKAQIEKEIREIKKSMKKSIKKKHMKKRAASEAMSQEMEEVIKRATSKSSKKKDEDRNKRSDKTSAHKKKKNNDPSTQIADKSALGQAFKRMRKEDDSDDSDSSSSGDSSSDSSDSDTDTDSDSSESSSDDDTSDSSDSSDSSSESSSDSDDSDTREG
ncbi:hypothetical protein H0H93_011927, partial [Arthromyces matolae]